MCLKHAGYSALIRNVRIDAEHVVQEVTCRHSAIILVSLAQ